MIAFCVYMKLVARFIRFTEINEIAVLVLTFSANISSSDFEGEYDYSCNKL